MARGRNFSVTIVVLSAVRELTRESIDHHISRTGIEGDYFVKGGGGRDDGDVGDAADVQRDAGAAGMTKEEVIDERDQGRAFAAGRDIARAKIRDDGNAEGFGQDSGLADLQGVGAAFVKDGLAVASDEGDG